MLVFIRDLGSSLMFFGGFLALLYVATNRLSFLVVGLVLFARRRVVLRARTSPHVQTASTPGSTRSTRRSTTSAAAATRSRSRCSRRPTAGCSARASAQALLKLAGDGATSLLPAAQTDLIYAVIVNELGLRRRGRGCCCIYLLFVERGFKIAMLAARLVLEAARRRA